MAEKSYSHLKSGTDVRGVALAVNGQKLTLTVSAIDDICAAFLKWLSKNTGKSSPKIAVGYDCRLSSRPIYDEIVRLALSYGCNVVGCGLCSTPSLYILLRESHYGCDGSIMITASHLPYYMNGLKFCTLDGGLESENLSEILEMAGRSEHLSRGYGKLTETSYMDEYCAKLVETVREGTGELSPLFGHIIVTDAGNGCGGFFVDKVLRPLGAITQGSINLNPDGFFPVHIPNPETPEAMKALRTAVLNSHAELGISFDTDVDRAAIVDGDGTEINRDRLIALVCTTLLHGDGGTIVTDSVTGDGLTEFINGLGGKHVRYKRGYKNVIDEAKRREQAGERCPLAIETSGHAAFRDNYYLDDGAYLICKLLITFALQARKQQKLSTLIESLKLPAEEKEIRLGFTTESKNFKTEGARVIDEIAYFAAHDEHATPSPDSYEGVRLNYADGDGDGWTLVRMSVHDPVMPINFASRVKGGTKVMARHLLRFVKKYPFLDTSELEAYAKKRF